ncbi:4-amino-4-deoxychorismate lyase [Micromonospora pattaloongensis]|uniref:4-amino-4-deoxychorismate lyase n=1 Tax=Micromonospora pattaloongensis TaxID=405436 RepID=A0A1H3GZH7_9ACTN|nr:aminotransferase class IV [Micromonospora pattaloongensis]SDY07769.1 4-amino-4-deoxychorismate lyase [Micromonospora pattaloongensis]
MSRRQVVAVLGRGVVPADTPVLPVTDRAVLHGDGLFETMHVRDARPWLPERHLARLRAAAAAIALPLPPSAELTALLDEVCAGWPAGTEGALRLVCTRGAEGGGPPVVFATLSEVDPGAIRARHAGIAVATLPLGVPAGARAGLGWLPAGIKSTSYAPNLAARRWAAANGVDDVLWTSTEGYALEAPTANLVWLHGDVLCTVPPADTGILPGVTAGWLLEQARTLGWSAEHRMVTPDQLRTDAGGVWLTSSLRGLAELRTLDGAPLAPSPHTPALRTLLGFP